MYRTEIKQGNSAAFGFIKLGEWIDKPHNPKYRNPIFYKIAYEFLRSRTDVSLKIIERERIFG